MKISMPTVITVFVATTVILGSFGIGPQFTGEAKSDIAPDASPEDAMPSALADVKEVASIKGSTKPKRKKGSTKPKHKKASTKPKRERVIGGSPAADAFAANKAMKIYWEEKAERDAVPYVAPVTPQPESAPDPAGTPNDQTQSERYPPPHAVAAPQVHTLEAQENTKTEATGSSELQVDSSPEIKEASDHLDVGESHMIKKLEDEVLQDSATIKDHDDTSASQRQTSGALHDVKTSADAFASQPQASGAMHDAVIKNNTDADASQRRTSNALHMASGARHNDVIKNNPDADASQRRTSNALHMATIENNAHAGASQPWADGALDNILVKDNADADAIHRNTTGLLQESATFGTHASANASIHFQCPWIAYEVMMKRFRVKDGHAPKPYAAYVWQNYIKTHVSGTMQTGETLMNIYRAAMAPCFNSKLLPFQRRIKGMAFQLMGIFKHPYAVNPYRAGLEPYTIKEFFSDCSWAFPELGLFFIDGEESAKTDTKCTGFSCELEYQRTIGALFAVYWLIRADWKGFIFGYDGWSARESPSGTTSEKRLSFMRQTEVLNQLLGLVTKAHCRGTPGWMSAEHIVAVARVAAMLSLTSFHDIMKIDKLNPDNSGTPCADHDKALADILMKNELLLLSYANMPNGKESEKAAKRAILFSLGHLDFNYGWFTQQEGPPGHVLPGFKNAISQPKAEDINFHFLHWFTDLSGAEGRPLEGAEQFVVTFPLPVLEGQMSSMPFLERLRTESATKMNLDYLKNRWQKSMGGRPIATEDNIAQMRLAIMAQVGPAQCISAFTAMNPADRQFLAKELSLTGMDERYPGVPYTVGPAFLLFCVPNMLQHCNGLEESFVIALEMLVSALRKARAIFPYIGSRRAETVTLSFVEVKTALETELNKQDRASKDNSPPPPLNAREFRIALSSLREAPVILSAADHSLCLLLPSTSFLPSLGWVVAPMQGDSKGGGGKDDGNSKGKDGGKGGKPGGGYGAPPPQYAPQYGAPPAGAPPAYGQPPPAYGAPMQYGAPQYAPQYGAPPAGAPPAYGQQYGAYGAAPPQYGG